MTLLERTQILLSQRIDAGMSLREIAGASGGQVNRDWLTKFAAGKIENPGVNSIQSLHDCLVKIPANSAT